jgi:hypothetical protein
MGIKRLVQVESLVEGSLPLVDSQKNAAFCRGYILSMDSFVYQHPFLDASPLCDPGSITLLYLPTPNCPLLGLLTHSGKK